MSRSRSPLFSTLRALSSLHATAGPRPNCATWKQRVDCDPGEIATAAVLEFDSSTTPRAWLGISLKCRAVTVQ